MITKCDRLIDVKRKLSVRCERGKKAKIRLLRHVGLVEIVTVRLIGNGGRFIPVRAIRPL